jgi:hypothetical protein
MLSNHDVAHADVGGDTTRHACEEDLANSVTLNERRGGCRRRDFSDPSAYQHHVRAMNATFMKGSRSYIASGSVRDVAREVRELLVHGGHDSESWHTAPLL